MPTPLKSKIEITFGSRRELQVNICQISVPSVVQHKAIVDFQFYFARLETCVRINQGREFRVLKKKTNSLLLFTRPHELSLLHGLHCL